MCDSDTMIDRVQSYSFSSYAGPIKHLFRENICFNKIKWVHCIAHSRFASPIYPSEDSICDIKQGTSLTELLIRCKLIKWDEAPMMHKYYFELWAEH